MKVENLPVYRFFASLKENKEYTLAEIKEIALHWCIEEHFAPISISEIRRAIENEKSVVYGIMKKVERDGITYYVKAGDPDGCNKNL